MKKRWWNCVCRAAALWSLLVTPDLFARSRAQTPTLRSFFPWSSVPASLVPLWAEVFPLTTPLPQHHAITHAVSPRCSLRVLRQSGICAPKVRR